MLFIKIKIKTKLKNITENTENLLETTAIKNKNKISYIANDILYKIIILDNQVILIRESQEFLHRLIFEHNKEITTEYYIKELNTSINILIKTTKLIKTDNKLEIDYYIVDSDTKYTYIIEVSD